MEFTETQAALIAGKSVLYGELYLVDFTSGAKHYWDGFGSLSVYDAEWFGAANVVGRSDIPFGVDDEAGQLTLTMSGVDPEIVAMVREAESEIVGRSVTLWGQFFGEDLQPSDERFFLFGGTMDVPTYSGSGPSSRSISVPVEGEFADRNGAAFSFFSDTDQKARFSGDRGGEYVYRYYQGVRRAWPTFS